MFYQYDVQNPRKATFLVCFKTDDNYVQIEKEP